MKTGDKVRHKVSGMTAMVIDHNETRQMIVIEYDGDHAFADRHGLSHLTVPRIPSVMDDFEVIE